MKKLINIFIFSVLLFTIGCGLTQGYWPTSSSPQLPRTPSTGLVHGTVMTPQGMYMFNGMDMGNGMSSGTIIGPGGGMSTFNSMNMGNGMSSGTIIGPDGGMSTYQFMR